MECIIMKFKFRSRNKVLIALLLHLLLLPENSECLSGPECNINDTAKPYVTISDSRNGPHLDMLDRSGFLDLSKYIHKTLCVNGVVVLYSGLSMEGPQNSTKIYNAGDPEALYHECVLINQIATAKAIELRDAGVHNPTLDDVDSSEITGKLATGIYLISEPLNLYLTTSVMFIQKNFNYKVADETPIKDGSFVTIGTGPFCLTVQDQFDIVLRGKDLKTTAICKWTILDDVPLLPEFKQRYDIVFNGSITRDKLSWRPCGPTAGSGGSGLGPYPKNIELTTTPSPAMQIDPFSIIDPKLWSLKPRKRPKLTLIADYDLEFNGTENSLTDEDLMEDFFINLDPVMCNQLRTKPTVVDPRCSNDTFDDNTICELLDVVLTIEPDPAKKTKLENELEWKADIMDIASEIFGKICEPFAKTMPFTIARVVAYYLARAHNLNPNGIRTKEREVWKFLKSELQRCNAGIRKSMLWYWDNRESFELRLPEKCKIEFCSFGCSLNDGEDKCESTTDLDCSNSVPVCSDDGCRFNLDTKTCVHPDPTHVCIPPSVCDHSDCAVDDTTWTCKVPFCTATSCQKPEDCVIMEKICIPKNAAGQTDGGAFPSAADFEAIASLLQKGMGETAGSGVPGRGLNNDDFHFELTDTQEVFRPRLNSSYNFNEYPINIMAVTRINKHTRPPADSNLIPQGNASIYGECLFFYEDMVETDFELNIAIDIHWKIWATVIGFCNNFYQLRKSETFPRLYNTYYEDFLEPIVGDWKSARDNEILRIILSGFNSEISQRWLDTCLESSYLVSNSSTYRPPRPLRIKDEESNYFIRIPDFSQAEVNPIDLTKENQTVKCP